MFFAGGRGGGMGGIGGGGGGGGVSGGGGNMMRALGRAVTRAGVAGLQDPISPTASTSPAPAAPASSKQARKSSAGSGSGSGSGSGLALSANPGAVPVGWTTSAFAAPYGSPFDEYGRDWEWVSADGSSSCSSDEKEVIYGLADEYFAMGPPPSADEVEIAVNELHQFVGSGRYTSLVRDRYGNEMMNVGIEDDQIWWRPLPKLASPIGSDQLDWKEPSPNPNRISQRYGSDTVHRAFHLLQNDQSVQRMVTSISSDAAIWDAVMNNEVVRELRQAYYPDENGNGYSMSQESTSDETGGGGGDSGDTEVDPSGNVVMWILENAKARIMELMESVAELMNKLFVPSRGEEGERDGGGGVGERGAGMITFEEKVATSFLLSVVVMLVVVVSRAQKA